MAHPFFPSKNTVNLQFLCGLPLVSIQMHCKFTVSFGRALKLIVNLQCFSPPSPPSRRLHVTLPVKGKEADKNFWIYLGFFDTLKTRKMWSS